MTTLKAARTSSLASELPPWFDGKRINEAQFCEAFLKENPMIAINEVFFTVDGRISDESHLKKQIQDTIKPYVTTGLSKSTANLLETLRTECWSPPLPLQQDRIHLANGTLFLDGTFSAAKSFCLNRLPVCYNPIAPRPEKWLHFLTELLEPDDIPTLQEFIGYCLIPSTKGQKMLLITGKGGEGKSRIGLVLRTLLGTNMNTGSLAKIEASPFARADLEHKLLMLDDDMKLEALPQTNRIKEIVTAELPMDLEKKGKQSYQGRLYARFLGFGNGTLRALHDRSVGFFRRQIILTAKERNVSRVDDPFLAEKLCAEAEGILLWALEGLQRLIANRYQFSLSDRAKENLEAAVADGNNIIEFLRSEGYFRFKEDGEASSRDLYAVYRNWCTDNAVSGLSLKAFGAFLKQNADDYGLEYTNKVHIGNGKHARGFYGIALLQKNTF